MSPISTPPGSTPPIPGSSSPADPGRPIPFSEQAWTAATDIRSAIDGHPFLRGLRSGTLPEAAFVTYLAQDAHYLVGYARALALCAAQATVADDIAFWASSAHETIVVERALHQAHVADLVAVEPSPTCTAYVSYLLATASDGSYPVLAAALLPCFWLYSDVGARMLDGVALDGHRYADWIAAYADPAFAASTTRGRAIVDTLAAASSGEVRQRMRVAFHAACRYEWMFFDAAWRSERWPAFGPANGSAHSTATTNDAIDADSHG